MVYVIVIHVMHFSFPYFFICTQSLFQFGLLNNSYILYYIFYFAEIIFSVNSIKSNIPCNRVT